MKKLLFSVIVLSIVSIQHVAAQCAMCRATVENNVNNGEAGIATGLNIGILYLFIAPYLLVAVIGILWYRHSKNKKTRINIQDRIVG